MRERFFETVLTVVNVANVVFEARETPHVTELLKNFSGTVGGQKCLVIGPQHDVRLDGGGQGPSDSFFIVFLGEQFERAVVKFEGLLVLACGGKHIRLDAEALGHKFRAAKVPGHDNGRVRQRERAAGIEPRFFLCGSI